MKTISYVGIDISKLTFDVARKPATLYWRIMVKGLGYTEKGIKTYEEKMGLQKEKWLLKAVKD